MPILSPTFAQRAIKSYGARGNGVTDDTAAIRAALAEAGAEYLATGRQQSLYVPRGLYIVSKIGSDFWCLGFPSGVAFHGPGTIKMAASQPANTVICSVQNVRDVFIGDGLHIDGNSANQGGDNDPKRHGIFHRGAINCTDRGVKFTNIDGDALYYGRGTASDGTEFNMDQVSEDIHIDGARRSGITLAQGASNVRFKGVYIKNWSGNQSAAANIESDGAFDTKNVLFEDLEVREPAPEAAHTCFGMSMTSAQDIRIIGGRFISTIFAGSIDDLHIEGINMDHPGSGHDFGNNSHPGGSGIQVRTECNRVTIKNNHIKIVGAAGGNDASFDAACIYVLNTNANKPKDVVIENNRLFPEAQRYGIATAGLAGVNTFKDNFVDGNNGSGRGIQCFTPNNAFDDIRLINNTVRNTHGGDAAIVVTTTANGDTNGFKRVTLEQNTVIDDQGSPTILVAYQLFKSGSSGHGDVIFDKNRWTSNIVTGASGFGGYRTGGNVASVQADGSILGAGHFEGTGSPEGVVTAGVGSLYTRLNGSEGTLLYLKESGTGNTGWRPVGFQTRSLTILHSDLTNDVDNTSSILAIGATLPANARIRGVDFRGFTEFTGGGLTSLTGKIGTVGDDDALIASVDLLSPAVDGGPAAITRGIRPNKTFVSAGAQLIITLSPDAAHDLEDATQGAVTIDVTFEIMG